jgi:hypothetical protein
VAHRACILWLLGAGLMAHGCSAPPPAPPPAPEPAAAPGVVAPVPEGPVVNSVEPWTFQGTPGRMIATDHYRIFTTLDESRLSRRIPLFMEMALTHYTSTLGPLPVPEAPLDMFLMAKRWQWQRLTQQLMGDQADMFLRIPRGGYSAGGRAVLYDIGQRDTLAIAAHEGWHQYTQRTFREGLPVWLEEGIATFMEGYRSDPAQRERPLFLGWANIERFDQLRAAAARGDLMPLDRLLEATPQSLLEDTTGGTLTYYAQVWALVHFLREGEGGRYRAGLEAVTRDAAAGQMRRTIEAKVGQRMARQAGLTRRGPGVVMGYFTLDLTGIGEQYDRFVDRLVRTGSKDLIVQGRSPFEAQ